MNAEFILSAFIRARSGPRPIDLFRHEFDRQARAPAVLFAFESLRVIVRRAIIFASQHARGRVKFAIADADAHARIRANVLDPVRFLAMLRENIKFICMRDKPYFDFARQTGFAPGRCEIQKLFFRHSATIPARARVVKPGAGD